jgi:copper chaperone NosL
MKKWIAIIVAVGAIAGALWDLEQPTQGVAPVAWNSATCAHCQMHLSDRRYAAQLQTKSGDVHNFDDPGCLFEWVADENPRIRQAYFRHYREARWLNYREVGFIRVDETTPMGYGLGAASKANHPKALSFSDASNAVLSGRIDATQGHAPTQEGRR